MIEPSLGEILAQALASTSPIDPGPSDEDVQFNCAAYLVRDVSPILRIDEREVFDALSYVPDAMLPMLETPQGWTALAAHVAADLGCDLPDYSPTLH